NGAVRNASLDLPSIAKPLAVRKADLRFSGNGISLDDVDISIGQTTAHGNLVANDFGAPRLQFALSANHINVAEWEQLFQSREKKPVDRTRSAAPNSATQESWINRTTGAGSLTADTVVYDELTLTNVTSTVTLDHGVIAMK